MKVEPPPPPPLPPPKNTSPQHPLQNNQHQNPFDKIPCQDLINKYKRGIPLPNIINQMRYIGERKSEEEIEDFKRFISFVELSANVLNDDSHTIKLVKVTSFLNDFLQDLPENRFEAQKKIHQTEKGLAVAELIQRTNISNIIGYDHPLGENELNPLLDNFLLQYEGAPDIPYSWFCAIIMYLFSVCKNTTDQLEKFLTRFEDHCKRIDDKKNRLANYLLPDIPPEFHSHLLSYISIPPNMMKGLMKRKGLYEQFLALEPSFEKFFSYDFQTIPDTEPGDVLSPSKKIDIEETYSLEAPNVSKFFRDIPLDLPYTFSKHLNLNKNDRMISFGTFFKDFSTKALRKHEKELVEYEEAKQKIDDIPCWIDEEAQLFCLFKVENLNEKNLSYDNTLAFFLRLLSSFLNSKNPMIWRDTISDTSLHLLHQCLVEAKHWAGRLASLSSPIEQVDHFVNAVESIPLHTIRLFPLSISDATGVIRSYSLLICHIDQGQCAVIAIDTYAGEYPYYPFRFLHNKLKAHPLILPKVPLSRLSDRAFVTLIIDLTIPKKNQGQKILYEILLPFLVDFLPLPSCHLLSDNPKDFSTPSQMAISPTYIVYESLRWVLRLLGTDPDALLDLNLSFKMLLMLNIRRHLEGKSELPRHSNRFIQWISRDIAWSAYKQKKHPEPITSLLLEVKKLCEMPICPLYRMKHFNFISSLSFPKNWCSELRFPGNVFFSSFSDLRLTPVVLPSNDITSHSIQEVTRDALFLENLSLDESLHRLHNMCSYFTDVIQKENTPFSDRIIRAAQLCSIVEANLLKLFDLPLPPPHSLHPCLQYLYVIARSYLAATLFFPSSVAEPTRAIYFPAIYAIFDRIIRATFPHLLEHTSPSLLSLCSRSPLPTATSTISLSARDVRMRVSILTYFEPLQKKSSSTLWDFERIGSLYTIIDDTLAFLLRYFEEKDHSLESAVGLLCRNSSDPIILYRDLSFLFQSCLQPGLYHPLSEEEIIRSDDLKPMFHHVYHHNGKEARILVSWANQSIDQFSAARILFFHHPWDPRSEEQILYEFTLTTFEEGLSEEESEILHSFLTVPYLRIPLLLEFLQTGRLALLFNKSFQEILTAVFFHPDGQHNFREKDSFPSNIPLEILFFEQSSVLVSEIVHNPETILHPLSAILVSMLEISSKANYLAVFHGCLFLLNLVARVLEFRDMNNHDLWRNLETLIWTNGVELTARWLHSALDQNDFSSGFTLSHTLLNLLADKPLDKEQDIRHLLLAGLFPTFCIVSPAHTELSPSEHNWLPAIRVYSKAVSRINIDSIPSSLLSDTVETVTGIIQHDWHCHGGGIYTGGGLIVDILLGTLSFSGSDLKKIPPSLQHHPDFNRVFKKSDSPSFCLSIDENTISIRKGLVTYRIQQELTAPQFQEFDYPVSTNDFRLSRFTLPRSDSLSFKEYRPNPEIPLPLSITRINTTTDNPTPEIFISSWKLKAYLPDILVESFCFWQIDFTTFKGISSLLDTFPFTLTLETKGESAIITRHNKDSTQLTLLDPDPHEALCQFLSRFEPLSQVLFWGRAGHLHSIEIPRSSLAFDMAYSLEGHPHLYFRENYQFILAEKELDQVFATVGHLPAFLLLESSSNNGEKWILLPKGDVSHSSPDKHDITFLDNCSGYYLYSITFHGLHSDSREAALYLFALHFNCNEYEKAICVIPLIAMDSPLTKEELRCVHLCVSAPRSPLVCAARLFLWDVCVMNKFHRANNLEIDLVHDMVFYLEHKSRVPPTYRLNPSIEALLCQHALKTSSSLKSVGIHCCSLMKGGEVPPKPRSHATLLLHTHHPTTALPLMNHGGGGFHRIQARASLVFEEFFESDQVDMLSDCPFGDIDPEIPLPKPFDLMKTALQNGGGLLVDSLFWTLMAYLKTHPSWAQLLIRRLYLDVQPIQKTKFFPKYTFHLLGVLSYHPHLFDPPPSNKPSLHWYLDLVTRVHSFSCENPDYASYISTLSDSLEPHPDYSFHDPAIFFTIHSTSNSSWCLDKVDNSLLSQPLSHIFHTLSFPSSSSHSKKEKTDTTTPESLLYRFHHHEFSSEKGLQLVFRLKEDLDYYFRLLMERNGTHESSEDLSWKEFKCASPPLTSFSRAFSFLTLLRKELLNIQIQDHQEIINIADNLFSIVHPATEPTLLHLARHTPTFSLADLFLFPCITPIPDEYNKIDDQLLGGLMARISRWQLVAKALSQLDFVFMEFFKLFFRCFPSLHPEEILMIQRMMLSPFDTESFSTKILEWKRLKAEMRQHSLSCDDSHLAAALVICEGNVKAALVEIATPTSLHFSNQRYVTLESYSQVIVSLEHATQSFLDLLYSSRHYLDGNMIDPRYLLFECTQGFFLKPEQVDILRDFKHSVDSKISVVKQMLMGQGKSSVIMPFLSLFLSEHQDYGGGVMCAVPESLLELSQTFLQRVLRWFGRRVFRFDFSRYTLYGSDAEEVCESIHRMLQFARQTKSVVLTTATSIKSFFLKYIELTHIHHQQYTNKNAPSVVIAQIGRILQNWKTSALLLDEVDLLLHPLTSELNYPTGKKTPLPYIHERTTIALRLMTALWDPPNKVLESLLSEGLDAHQLQKSPHLILVDPSFYHKLIQPLAVVLASLLEDQVRHPDAFFQEVIDTNCSTSCNSCKDSKFFDSSNVIDGNEETFWCSNEHPKECFWQIHWRRSQRLGALSIHFKALSDFFCFSGRSMVPLEVELQLSSDNGKTWVVVSQNSKFIEKKIYITPPSFATDLRIVMRGTAHWFAIEKIHFFCSPFIPSTTPFTADHFSRILTSPTTPSIHTSPLPDQLFNFLALAHGFLHSFFPHAIGKNNRVSYGLLPPSHLENPLESEGRKLLAVPFIGKDTPSPSSEFQHPNVQIMLTILAYHTEGLRLSDIFSLFTHLQQRLRIEESGPLWLRPSYLLFELWTTAALKNSGSSDPSADFYVLPLHLFNPENAAQLRDVHILLGTHPPTIEYYLVEIAFPRALRVHSANYTASGDDLGSPTLFQIRLGFSGTPSTLLPQDLGQCDFQSGTEGEILHVLSSPKKVSLFQLPSSWYPQDILNCCTTGRLFHALIDTGALVTGLSNREVAFILKHKFDTRMQGIVFLENGQKMILVDNGVFPLEISSVPASQRFTYYDHSHTTGMDIYQTSDAAALITLGKDMTFRDYAQGSWRMRELSKSQRLTVILTPEIEGLIQRDILSEGRRGLSLNQESILEWLLSRTLLSERICEHRLLHYHLSTLWRSPVFKKLLVGKKMELSKVFIAPITFGMGPSQHTLHSKQWWKTYGSYITTSSEKRNIRLLLSRISSPVASKRMKNKCFSFFQRKIGPSSTTSRQDIFSFSSLNAEVQNEREAQQEIQSSIPEISPIKAPFSGKPFSDVPWPLSALIDVDGDQYFLRLPDLVLPDISLSFKCAPSHLLLTNNFLSPTFFSKKTSNNILPRLKNVIVVLSVADPINCLIALTLQEAQSIRWLIDFAPEALSAANIPPLRLYNFLSRKYTEKTTLLASYEPRKGIWQDTLSARLLYNFFDCSDFSQPELDHLKTLIQSISPRDRIFFFNELLRFRKRDGNFKHEQFS